MPAFFTERKRYVETLAQDLDSLVEQLGAMPAVQQVILFGSYAAGRRDLRTDLDLLVIMESPLDFVTRNVDLARRLQAGVTLDLLVYTPQEIKQMHDRPFIRRILETGKVLYERNTAS
jgi:predicted nucleotidyltransferase